MRVGELALEWRDVDVTESRFRIRQGKTVSARRWVRPEWLMDELGAMPARRSCPGAASLRRLNPPCLGAMNGAARRQASRSSTRTTSATATPR